MTKKRPHLTARTTALLNHLATFGPGGAVVDQLAAMARLRTRQTAQRLRWLQRTHLVRYHHETARWQLQDDSMFHETETQ